MNGNITQQGIKLDLEWMHRVGIGGFQAFDGNLLTPQVVKDRLVYMSPGWKEAFKYATTLAEQLGLEESIASSPGWSETGGPWVKPEAAMKKYVWSETPVEGGKPFSGVLTHPPSNTGAFQDLKIEGMSAVMGASFHAPDFYADSAAVAYRVPASDTLMDALRPKITSSGGTIDAAILSDGDLVKTISLPLAKSIGDKAWIQYEFDRPQTIRSLTITIPGGGFMGFGPPPKDGSRAFEASDDGENYRLIALIPLSGATEHTLSFAPVTAKYFRVTFKTVPQASNSLAELGFRPPPPNDVKISELLLRPGARVNRFEDKAAFSVLPDLYGFPTPPVTADEVIQKSEVIDLISKMHPDGSLDWDPPEGHWVVLRIGYSLIGTTNNPAPAEATGLEVDKLSTKFVKSYMDNYLGMFQDTVGRDNMGKRGIRYLLSDSWEAGFQNWTDDMLAQFSKQRGYDPRPWLPVLAGHVVVSAQASDQFLWDFRKTIADLIATAHYGQVDASVKERDMGHYGESHESGRALIADGMEIKKLDDVPMSAMWTQPLGQNKPLYRYIADDRESASVAHIYGQNLAAAESMTSAGSAWGWSPRTLKPTADQEFLSGINRIAVHESTHQPLIDKAPGLTVGPFGQMFNRNDTWAEQAGAWVDYLARTSYMLQQGKFCADVIYFYGEDSNITAIFREKAPPIPVGYNYDYVNADALIHVLTASAGLVGTPGGVTYHLLALDPFSRNMSLPVLRAIYKLVKSGANISGEKPIGSPSLADDPAEYKQLSDELFGDGTGVHSVGKGKVYAGFSVSEALRTIGVPVDFDSGQPVSESDEPLQQQRVYFLHRRLADGDVYFLDNRSDQAATIEANFRVTGKTPELWYAETGKSRPAPYKIADARTTVPLSLEPWGTVFVVFRKPARSPRRAPSNIVETQVATIDGPWSLSFQPGRGAPASVTMNTLSDWSKSTDPGIRYFSGIGTYTKMFDVPASWNRSKSQFSIDLGDVENLATVTINGKAMGQVWHAPFRVEVTDAIHPGQNEITISVVNLWVNRLIGDEQTGATKYTFAGWHQYKANSPLLPSGLLGPVSVIRSEAR
jgi:hypothetical protein